MTKTDEILSRPAPSAETAPDPAAAASAREGAPLALITGGGGFLGRHLVAKLLARGWRVRVYGRRPYPDLAEQGAECVRGDILSAPTLRSACQGVDVVFHTAALAGMSGPRQPYFDVNHFGSLCVLGAAEGAGVGRLVYTSTPSVVYGCRGIDGGDETLPYPKRYLSAYAESKARAEWAIRSADGKGLRTVALRPHLVWGPGDNHLFPTLLARAEAGTLRRIGNGGNRVSVTYVENAADAHLAAADALERDPETVGGRAYFVNDDDPVNCWDFIDDFLKRCGAKPPSGSVPGWLAYQIGACSEAWAWLRGYKLEPPMTRFLALQLSTTHWFHNDAAKHDLGWTPAIGLEEAWKRTLADLKALRRRQVAQHMETMAGSPDELLPPK